MPILRKVSGGGGLCGSDCSTKWQPLLRIVARPAHTPHGDDKVEIAISALYQRQPIDGGEEILALR